MKENLEYLDGNVNEICSWCPTDDHDWFRRLQAITWTSDDSVRWHMYTHVVTQSKPLKQPTLWIHWIEFIVLYGTFEDFVARSRYLRQG